VPCRGLENGAVKVRFVVFGWSMQPLTRSVLRRWCVATFQSSSACGRSRCRFLVGSSAVLFCCASTCFPGLLSQTNFRPLTLSTIEQDQDRLHDMRRKTTRDKDPILAQKAHRPLFLLPPFFPLCPVQLARWNRGRIVISSLTFNTRAEFRLVTRGSSFVEFFCLRATFF